MRKIVFIVLAVVIAAIAVFFGWRELSIPDLNFVTDYTSANSSNHIKVQRLYSAEVDVAEYNKTIESIINTAEYTDEEMLAAAAAAGKPEFFPAFSLGLYRQENEIRLDGFVTLELAPGQDEQRFHMESLNLESVISQGNLVIEQVDVTPSETHEDEIIYKINSEKTANVSLTNANGFEMVLNGDDGTVVMRFVYSVKSDSVISKVVLEEQVLEIHAVVSTGSAGNLEVEFTAQPYTIEE